LATASGGASCEAVRGGLAEGLRRKLVWGVTSLVLKVDDFLRREINRRQFLGRSACQAASVAAGVVSLATSAPAGPNERLHVAVLGVRNRGRELAGLLAARPDVEVRMLGDVDAGVFPAAVAAVVEQGRPAPQCERDVHRVLEHPQIDAVFIATPDHSHVPLAKLACQAGKDVYLESPATWCVGEGPELVNVVRQTRRIVQCGVQERSSQALQAALAVVRGGQLGKVHLVRAWTVHRRKPIPPKPDTPPPADLDYAAWLGSAPPRPFNANRYHFNWRWYWDYGGGELAFWGSHWLDLARLGLELSWPRRIAAAGSVLPASASIETPDALTVQFDCGATTVLWEHRLSSNHGVEGRSAGVAFYGERGVLILDRGGWKVYDGEPLHGTASVKEMEAAHLENFLECVRSRATPVAPVADAVISAGWCHLGNLSYRLRRELRFDAERLTCPDTPEAAALLTRSSQDA
jgi:predicted dehydrogenase